MLSIDNVTFNKTFLPTSIPFRAARNHVVHRFRQVYNRHLKPHKYVPLINKYNFVLFKSTPDR